MENAQSILDDLASQYDKRVSVFDLQIRDFRDGIVTLKGRLLDKSQLETLAGQFPNQKLDTASVRILTRGSPAHAHVSTNVTGLYEGPSFGVPLMSELIYGTDLEILEEHGKWAFLKQQDGYLGWAFKPYLGDGFAPEPATHLVLAPACELRAEPAITAEILTRVVSGTRVRLLEKTGDWSLVGANRTGWIPSCFLRGIADIPATVEGKRDLLLEDSRRMIGIPYLWGGTCGNGIDCSGFVRLLHRWAGMEILRDADMQHAEAHPVEPPYQVGDLFFFEEGQGKRKITHVGMSLGGWKMIHSSRLRNGVYIDDLHKVDSLKGIFKCAGSFLR